SRQIRDWLARNSPADLAGDNVVSRLASEFGVATRHRPLRNLFNDETMSTVDVTDPHALCCVLTGAIWAAMVRNHQFALQKAMEEAAAAPRAAPPGPSRDAQIRGRALGISARRMARILFRA